MNACSSASRTYYDLSKSPAFYCYFMTQQPQPFAGHFLRLQSSFTHNLIWLCRSAILYFLFASKRNKKTELLKFDRSPPLFSQVHKRAAHKRCVSGSGVFAGQRHQTGSGATGPYELRRSDSSMAWVCFINIVENSAQQVFQDRKTFSGTVLQWRLQPHSASIQRLAFA